MSRKSRGLDSKAVTLPSMAKIERFISIRSETLAHFKITSVVTGEKFWKVCLVLDRFKRRNRGWDVGLSNGVSHFYRNVNGVEKSVAFFFPFGVTATSHILSMGVGWIIFGKGTPASKVNSISNEKRASLSMSMNETNYPQKSRMSKIISSIYDKEIITISICKFSKLMYPLLSRQK